MNREEFAARVADLAGWNTNRMAREIALSEAHAEALREDSGRTRRVETDLRQQHGIRLDTP